VAKGTRYHVWNHLYLRWLHQLASPAEEADYRIGSCLLGGD